MNLLRIRCGLSDEPLWCRWVLRRGNAEPVGGEGLLTDLPHSDRVQLILPAAQVLFVRVRLPGRSRSRRDGPLLAFAVEEKTLPEPDANQVTWVGAEGDEDVVAVVDKEALQRVLDTFASVAIHVDEVYCETLLLPRTAGEWSLVWEDGEAFTRTGEFEGAATDCGGRASPPLSLHLMLKEAETRGARPTSIALHTTMPANELAGEAITAPDIEAWQRELGIPIHLGGTWDWRAALPDSSVDLLQGRKQRQNFSGILKRLRPAGWIAGAVLAIHAMALTAEWIWLANEQRALRQQMESRFRAIFPAAVAVVDPALQMRRKLVEARRAAGLPDRGDFLPMIETVAPGLRELAPGSLRAISYDSGKLMLELAIDEAGANRIAAYLRKSGLSVETSPTRAGVGSEIAIIQVRAS
jgi:general secretion pathway protein L